jgi:hypothetical protein
VVPSPALTVPLLPIPGFGIMAKGSGKPLPVIIPLQSLLVLKSVPTTKLLPCFCRQVAVVTVAMGICPIRVRMATTGVVRLQVPMRTTWFLTVISWSRRTLTPPGRMATRFGASGIYKLTMNKERLLYLLILAACILYIIKLHREIDGMYETSSQTQAALEHKIKAYRYACDSLNTVNVLLYESISNLSVQTDSLKKLKQTTIIKHDRIISNLRNPAIISNDSIDRYIRSKINSRQ